MKAILYNRVLLCLAFIGLFIAGVLSLAKAMHVIVPCGGARGCDVVTNDSSSYFMGIPVAYIGLGGYLILAGLAVLRAIGAPNLFRKLVLPGYLVAAFGTIVSIGLQCYSLFVIREMCKWCLASAATMTATVIVYALMYQWVADHPSEEIRPTGPRSSFEFLFASGLAVVLLFSLSAEGWALKHADAVEGVMLDKLKNPDILIPSSPNRFGDPMAPVTIIEFADLNCPSCQQNSPLVKEYVRQHAGKVQLIFRHLPLPMHKTSAIAAAIDEYAAEKGKFWDYTLAVMATHKEVETSDELFTIATSVGLNADDIQKRLANNDDPIYKRLTEDQNAAGAIGVVQTPTFIVLAPGIKPQAFPGSQLRDALSGPPYDKFTNAK